ncbi:MAG: glutathione S-transferase family protein [Gammaproteobacteria bacterium]|nr:glutathione S-transferase family protein [Gammaproteobacteria bacterium]
MSEYTVHLVPGSPFARAVLATLEEKNTLYKVAPVVPGTLRAPPHLRLHPFGRVPVLEHGDFRLYETQAILRYLDRILPEPPLTPADARRAARMDQVLNINDWYLFTGAGAVIGFQRVVGPRLMGLTADENAIAAAVPKARVALDVLAHLLGTQPYLAGASVTLADLMVAPQLDFLQKTPEWEALSAAHPNLRQWLARMQARPSLLATTWEKVAARAAATGAATPRAAAG